MPKPALTVASLLPDPELASACAQALRGDRYQLVPLDPQADVTAELDRRREEFDLLLVDQRAVPSEKLQLLAEHGLLLPAVLIGRLNGSIGYHDAEVHLQPDQLEQLSYSLDAAVSRFLRRGLLSTGNRPPGASGSATPESWQLARRLQGRLGYLGVFYKRDPSRFLRNLPATEAEELLASLQRTYRDLLLSYFRDPGAANQALENFVNTAFFSDLPITKAVEIHMNLIEGFWKQLRLEGHKDDFLQDYRLALLDVMAHLCEMYRRSLPPDTPLGARSLSAAMRDASSASALEEFSDDQPPAEIVEGGVEA
ncbi:MAG: circadian clock protein KaiA [Prochlorococcaceae cyanobacterium]|jgi:circadian clock protein KaiA